MNTSEVLYAAADHIDGFGLCKERLHGRGDPEVTPACAVGALRVAAGLARVSHAVTNQDMTRAYMAMISQVGLTLGRGSIVDWNNAPERTAAEVVEVLRAAAVIEAAKETDMRVVAARQAVCA